MEINNKERQISWKQVAKQYESERDALQKEVFDLREKLLELEFIYQGLCK